ncbi:spore coat protein SP65-like [Periplaneta americana]|uniref:spore coat protein SP65-like n=1 Tax=Periplaneta americana TaxID=6978 RepID=UPI0037E9606B
MAKYMVLLIAAVLVSMAMSQPLIFNFPFPIGSIPLFIPEGPFAKTTTTAASTAAAATDSTAAATDSTTAAPATTTAAAAPATTTAAAATTTAAPATTTAAAATTAATQQNIPSLIDLINLFIPKGPFA